MKFVSSSRDANVFIVLYGDKGDSGQRGLDSEQDNFKRGKTDYFGIECKSKTKDCQMKYFIYFHSTNQLYFYFFPNFLILLFRCRFRRYSENYHWTRWHRIRCRLVSSGSFGEKREKWKTVEIPLWNVARYKRRRWKNNSRFISEVDHFKKILNFCMNS